MDPELLQRPYMGAGPGVLRLVLRRGNEAFPDDQTVRCGLQKKTGFCPYLSWGQTLPHVEGAIPPEVCKRSIFSVIEQKCEEGWQIK